MKYLDKEFVRYLKTDLEMSDSDIALNTANEIFSEVLAYEGHGISADISIKRWVQLIYGIDLDDVSEKIRAKERGTATM